MSFPSVTINQLQGSISRQQTGYDFYSGLMLYGTAPTVTGKWATQTGDPSIKFQQLFSPSDATSAGILPNTDNTASTSTYLISNIGGTGDTVNLTCTLPKQAGTTEVVDLGTYTVNAAVETTIALQGAAWAVVINAGTLTHGFSASFNTATLTLTAPKSAGKSLNTGTPFTRTIGGTAPTLAVTVTQNVVAGTASQHAAWYYHISETFRVNPFCVLYVGIISSSSSFNELKTLQAASVNKLRQIGVYDIDATRGAAANLTGTILQVQNSAVDVIKTAPFQVFYSPNIAAVTDLSTLTDQNLNTAHLVQCVISQDGLASGALLYVQLGQSIGNIGAKIGSISKSRVSASDAQPIADFNMSDGVENNTFGFANGKLDSEVTEGLKIQLDNFRYTFFRPFGDTLVGTYWTDNKCCITSTDSYAFVNDNRVMHKISRICYSTLVPLLNSEIIFNSDGTLRNTSIQTFRTAVVEAITANMITGYGSLPLISGVSVSIDPTQKVQTTNNLIINVIIVQNGIARNITVNLSYGTL